MTTIRAIVSMILITTMSPILLSTHDCLHDYDWYSYYHAYYSRFMSAVMSHYSDCNV